jgi:mannose-1-phosphate guanylyltransferase
VIAVVLVGGFGTRLRPLTLHTPKQMLPVVDRPMIEWVLAELGKHGVDQAVLALGYKPDAFQAAYPDGVCAGVELHYAVEPEPLDTAGAIRFAARDAGVAERFIVCNGDVLTDLDITRLVAFHDERGAAATIALHQVDDPSRYGVVPTGADGHVEAFVEKPPPGEAPTDRINAGTYVLEPGVIDHIADGRRVSIERETFPALVGERSLFALDDDGVYWLDTGTPDAYLAAQLDALDGRRGVPVDGIAADATIDPTASIERSVVRAGATIGAGAMLRDAVVLDGATIGAGARVEGSIVGPGAIVSDGATVDGLSVLGEGVVIAPGELVRGAKVPEEA